MRKKIIINFFLTISSIIIGLILAEGILRLVSPYGTYGGGNELKYMRNNLEDLSEAFTIDSDFGFRPILNNKGYSEFGTLMNDYNITKKTNITRLLFIGDSVTARGKMITALKEIYGNNYEYWNAGVESFNTIQEVNYYKKYNYRIKPDHVILTFSINDFETTPVAFFNHEKKLVVYQPNKSSQKIDPWLFKNVYLYRLFLGLTTFGSKEFNAIANEIKYSLKDLRDILKKDNISLTVLVHPSLKPYEQWKDKDKKSREKILQILNDLNIEHYDFLIVLQEAIKNNVDIQENKGDSAHPSNEMAKLYVQYIFKKGFFKKSAPI